MAAAGEQNKMEKIIEKQVFIDTIREIISNGMSKKELLNRLKPTISYNTLERYLQNEIKPSNNKYDLLVEQINKNLKDEYQTAQETLIKKKGFNSISDYKVFLYQEMLRSNENG